MTTTQTLQLGDIGENRNDMKATTAPAPTKYVLVVCALMPIMLVGWYIITIGNTVPVGDQWWDPVYIATKTATGILTMEDLLTYYEGHRPAIIRLITALFTLLTDFDVRLLRFAPVFTALLNLGLAVSLLSRIKAVPPAIFLFAVVLFTLHYPSNWLDYYFSCWQQALTFMLLGLLVLQRMLPSWLSFALVVLCAATASFSSGAGLPAWICLPIAAAGIRAYRRPQYLLAWLAVFGLFIMFYVSSYAGGPSGLEGTGASPGRALELGFIPYLIKFQAVRFDTDSINRIALAFTFISFLCLMINIWWTTRLNRDMTSPAVIWASLALFSVGMASLTALRQIVSPLQYEAGLLRYSPGGDAFWVAFVALALLALASRPPRILKVINVVMLLMLLVLTAQKEIWFIERTVGAARSLSKSGQHCHQCVLEYPLRRDGCLQICFVYSEEESVYHLAALRLSIFKYEAPHPILAKTDALVITDMPNRWLSVYVRDWLLAGTSEKYIYSVAPVPGQPPRASAAPSPYYKEEWSTEILPNPLRQTYNGVAAFTPSLAALTVDQSMVWYINTPETETNLPVIEQELAKLNFNGRHVRSLKHAI